MSRTENSISRQATRHDDEFRVSSRHSRKTASESSRKRTKMKRISAPFAALPSFSSFPLPVYSGPVKFSGYLVNTASSFFVFFRELGIVHRDHNRRGSGENRPSSLLLNEKKNLYLCFKQHSSLSPYSRRCEYSKSCNILNYPRMLFFERSPSSSLLKETPFGLQYRSTKY